MSYQFLEGLTSADAAFEATGKDPADLLLSAGEAILNLMVNPKDIRFETSRSLDLKVTADTEEKALHELLYDFLQKLIFFKDAEGLLLRADTLRWEKTEKGVWSLGGTLKGDRIDPARHSLGIDVKGVTMHRYEVARSGSGWKATVIVDV